MRYKETLAHLNALPRFAGRKDAAYKPGLARMEQLMEAMDRPHETFASVHVAGTNGKGSTASLLAAVGTASGRRVGLHTSPHLAHVTERMRTGGTPAPRDWLADAVARFRPALDAVQPSFFEATVALSFLYFAEEGVDLAVVEVGLGGRLDATNVLRPRLSIITNIGHDHEALLGETLAQVAREKAGIVKPGVPVLTAVEGREALRVIEEVAASQEALLHRLQEEADMQVLASTLGGLTLRARTPLRPYDALHIGLAGRHQAANALLAVRAAELLFAEVRESAAPVYAGLRDVQRLAGLRGRCEVLRKKPLVVADVAHNPDGLAAALRLLRPHLEAGRLYALFGVMRDKDVAAMARPLAEACATVWPVPLASERAVPAPELAKRLSRSGVAARAAGPAGEPAAVPEGIKPFRRQAAPEDVLLITGSHQVVAACFADDRRWTTDD